MEDKISIKAAISYLFDNEKKWKHIFTWIGLFFAFMIIMTVVSLVTIIPILGIILACIIYPLIFIAEFIGYFFVIGYVYEVISNVRNGKKELPEVLVNYKERLYKGFYIMLIGSVYFTPTIIISTIVYVLAFIPFIFISESGQELAGGLTAVLVIFSILLYMVLVALTAINGFLVNAALYRYYTHEKLGEAFKFSEVFEIFKKGWAGNMKLFWKRMLIRSLVTLIMLVVYGAFILAFVLGEQLDQSLQIFIVVAAICVYFISILAIMAGTFPLVTYIYPHMKGQLFRMWDKEGLKKI